MQVSLPFLEDDDRYRRGRRVHTWPALTVIMSMTLLFVVALVTVSSIFVSREKVRLLEEQAQLLERINALQRVETVQAKRASFAYRRIASELIWSLGLPPPRMTTAGDVAVHAARSVTLYARETADIVRSYLAALSGGGTTNNQPRVYSGQGGL